MSSQVSYLAPRDKVSLRKVQSRAQLSQDKATVVHKYSHRIGIYIYMYMPSSPAVTFFHSSAFMLKRKRRFYTPEVVSFGVVVCLATGGEKQEGLVSIWASHCRGDEPQHEFTRAHDPADLPKLLSQHRGT